jgi:hypothetical protein
LCGKRNLGIDRRFADVEHDGARVTSPPDNARIERKANGPSRLDRKRNTAFCGFSTDLRGHVIAIVLWRNGAVPKKEGA